MESLHYLLMRCHAGMSRRVMARAAGLGLSAGQPKVLDLLRTAGAADLKAIAANCLIEPATVGGILLRMEKAGLVCRRRRCAAAALREQKKERSPQRERSFFGFVSAAGR